MADERSYIEKTLSIAEKRTGEVPSPDEIVQRFALYGLDKRVQMLDAMDADPQGAIPSGPDEMRKVASERKLRARLGEMHAALRRVGR